jgi:transcriptional regulator with XRE-family HTH domain
MTTDGYQLRLRAARIEAGLDQRQLARLIGCSDSTVSAVERGQQQLSAARLILWCDACGVSLDAIAHGEAAQASA